jgi:hypothetical protein
VRTPGQPNGAARVQGQPGQPAAGAKPLKPPAKAHPKPEEKKGEKEK